MIKNRVVFATGSVDLLLTRELKVMSTVLVTYQETVEFLHYHDIRS